MSVASIVETLQKAAKAYYESDTPIMTDEEYDALWDRLKQLDPKNPFLETVGSTPGGGVTLPVPMASLTKVKDTFTLPQTWTCMDKLDGISALWVCGYNQKKALYLRGNGLVGLDITHCSPWIQGLKQAGVPSAIIRGELIVPKRLEIKNSRNWVNGLVHRSDASPDDLKQVHFVAYAVYKPGKMNIQQQHTWLLFSGFEVVHHEVLPNMTNNLKELFLRRRAEGPYEVDGIVCMSNTSLVMPEAKNPSTQVAFAFKMPLQDQTAETTVREIDWASSRTGNWIPRVRFDPVQIGDARIEYCAGNNARNIQEKRLGPGAKIIIRRSGDVIPYLDQVLIPAEAWSPPPPNRWKWDATNTHAVDTTPEATPETLAVQMVHTLTSLEIEGISKTSAKKLVDGGLNTFVDVYKAAEDKLQSILGKANGLKLYTALRDIQVGEDKWIRAYCGWPKGFGESRIAAFLALKSNPAEWPTLTTTPKGVSEDSLMAVQAATPGYLAWRGLFKVASVAPAEPAPTAAHRGYYVMSGFRDASLQATLASYGWELQDSVKKNTTLLIVPDGFKETTKVKAARQAGVKIVPRSQVELSELK